mmetsp:Transcript_124541/g.346743  ORF Transcript_124541/g.346743 Transcript_124541/m.346743 type:complete len:142 (+) Transcript_124541:103-528(+)|eukprot:CAMPEP_0179068328 /NCGR_PEP_ID=MMETSP0796-20121207/29946_1 /TAXON_ID=73915 /ORGANISM="Pyrodinium bahamense, Strain pbaha01" /LENGTH=141 /DNA_ID=CAMNT_0020765381 /DNA_START=103 /DNA_END=528 /DNA_ORIENTATION=+
MLASEARGPAAAGRSFRYRGDGCSFVPLEVGPPADSTVTAEEAGCEEPAYQHRLLSRRLSDAANQGRAQRDIRKKRCAVGFLTFSCVIAGIFLWGWALVLLLLRLNAMRHVHHTAHIAHLALVVGPEAPRSEEDQHPVPLG